MFREDSADIDLLALSFMAGLAEILKNLLNNNNIHVMIKIDKTKIYFEKKESDVSLDVKKSIAKPYLPNILSRILSMPWIGDSKITHSITARLNVSTKCAILFAT